MVSITHKRLPKESFEDYKKRRKTENLNIKAALKPRVIWSSHINGTLNYEQLRKEQAQQ